MQWKLVSCYSDCHVDCCFPPSATINSRSFSEAPLPCHSPRHTRAIQKLCVSPKMGTAVALASPPSWLSHLTVCTPPLVPYHYFSKHEGGTIIRSQSLQHVTPYFSRSQILWCVLRIVLFSSLLRIIVFSSLSHFASAPALTSIVVVVVVVVIIVVVITITITDHRPSGHLGSSTVSPSNYPHHPSDNTPLPNTHSASVACRRGHRWLSINAFVADIIFSSYLTI
jgi:hypothetical protein